MRNQIPTVGSSVYESLKRDIVFGTLEPGTKLKLDPLKNRYAASVSTLRETLRRLASEGFVSAEDQKGFFVAPVSKNDLIEIANLRILLESHALKESIEKGDTEWEASVLAAHHKLSQLEGRMISGDHSVKETWKRYDWEFHQSLIQACNSRNLLGLYATIFEKYFRYQMLVLTFRGGKSKDEHFSLMTAALDRNVEGAVSILKTHVTRGLTHAISAFDGQTAAKRAAG